MSKVLVTGGAGFIGSWLCEFLLEQKHEVTCVDNLFSSSKNNIRHLLDNKNFEFVRHDVCEPFHFEVDQVYHLACPASPVYYQKNPVRTIETAFLGTRNALECARNTGAKLLITSTSEVYGDPEQHPQQEDYWGNVNPVGDRSCYDEGKRIGESLAVSWSKQYGTDVRIARLFNCYGPRMALHDGRLIPNFILQQMKYEPLTIYGDGHQTRSFCYISDTVDALVKLMNLRITSILKSSLGIPVPIINIGNPDERMIKDVAFDIISAFGGEGCIIHAPLPKDDPKQRCPDITRAKRILGWEPKVSYSDGMAKTIASYMSKGFR